MCRLICHVRDENFDSRRKDDVYRLLLGLYLAEVHQNLDGTGLVTFKGSELVDFFKTEKDAQSLLVQRPELFKNYFLKDIDCIIGHIRKATTDYVDAASAHPFVFKFMKNEKNKILVAAHNGSFDTSTLVKFCKKYNIENELYTEKILIKDSFLTRFWNRKKSNISNSEDLENKSAIISEDENYIYIDPDLAEEENETFSKSDLDNPFLDNSEADYLVDEKGSFLDPPRRYREIIKVKSDSRAFFKVLIKAILEENSFEKGLEKLLKNFRINSKFAMIIRLDNDLYFIRNHERNLNTFDLRRIGLGRFVATSEEMFLRALEISGLDTPEVLECLESESTFQFNAFRLYKMDLKTAEIERVENFSLPIIRTSFYSRVGSSSFSNIVKNSSMQERSTFFKTSQKNKKDKSKKFKKGGFFK